METKGLSDIVKNCVIVTRDKIENNSQEDHTLQYHNWRHTETVFQAVNEIAGKTSGIVSDELEIMQLSVLFHDVCFSRESKSHEKESAEFAEDILRAMDYPGNKIETVKKLILATSAGHQPTDILEQIVRDADLYHLKNPDYLETGFINLYNERKIINNMSPKEWVQECIDFFDSHNYNTDYAKSNFEEGKRQNREKLVELLKMEISDFKEVIKQSPKKKKKKNIVKEKEAPGRGIETLFRVSLRNHVNLSVLADNKANTLISVNAIIISIVLSALFPKFDKNQFLLLPAITLVSFSIVTIIISIISTIPRTSHGLLTREDVENRKGNLIFFGNFHKMPVDDYEWGMEELMKDKDYLYKCLIRDLFYLGKVLNRKYVFLRIAYFVFVIGLVISIILFIFSLKNT